MAAAGRTRSRRRPPVPPASSDQSCHALCPGPGTGAPPPPARAAFGGVGQVWLCGSLTPNHGQHSHEVLGTVPGNQCDPRLSDAESTEPAALGLGPSGSEPAGPQAAIPATSFQKFYPSVPSASTLLSAAHPGAPRTHATAAQSPWHPVPDAGPGAPLPPTEGPWSPSTEHRAGPPGPPAEAGRARG